MPFEPDFVAFDRFRNVASPLPGPVEQAERAELIALLLDAAYSSDRRTLGARCIAWDSDRLEVAVVVEDLVRRERNLSTRQRHDLRESLAKLPLPELRKRQQQ